ncbi:hypothetical protein M422DRAFT_254354 [Sphaerobolus stellatus SS14]|uniref:CxC2-like cysteine cluster KDZ transposase-associated domain-containing protein n=1 Tax=Sphaerobolus stellatus (strain SS14) TaxID=990650 RepID=A0A0C9VVC8_SPHS4|nr:hypothetical protein M422DRAFT_254354 [Sphaerobolus stellatus SS14]
MSLISKHKLSRELRNQVQRRRGKPLADPRNVVSVKMVDGQEVIWQERRQVRDESQNQEDEAQMSGMGHSVVRPMAGVSSYQAPQMQEYLDNTEGDNDRDIIMDEDGDFGIVLEVEGSSDEEPVPDTHNSGSMKEASEELLPNSDLRAMALEAFYEQESPASEACTCLGVGSSRIGVYDCIDCDLDGLFCRDCLLDNHQWHPFHRPMEWMGDHFEHRRLGDVGAMLPLGHGGEQCRHIADDLGPQKMMIADVTGVHKIMVGWCRCAHAPSAVQQLFQRRLFPATIIKPRTAFTFRTSPWDFVGTMHRLTDNVNPQGSPDIYKTFKEVQHQWRIVRAWKRAGVMDPFLAREPGSLAMPCVSCPLPGVNLDEDWANHPDSELIHTVYIGGDGNFRLRQHNKGLGEASDPSLFGDDAFYAPDSDYKDFYHVRAGAADDTAVNLSVNIEHGSAGNKLDRWVVGRTTVSAVHELMVVYL